MNNDELKKKIEDILEEYNFETDDGEGWILDTEEMADALIAAGIGFYKTHLTTFQELDVKLRATERRAEVEERALRVLARKFVIFAFPNGDWKELIEQLVSETKKQAEKELAEEKKDD